MGKEKTAILHRIIRGEVGGKSLEAINNRIADVPPSERLSGASKRNCAPLRTGEHFALPTATARGSGRPETQQEGALIILVYFIMLSPSIDI